METLHGEMAKEEPQEDSARNGHVGTGRPPRPIWRAAGSRLEKVRDERVAEDKRVRDFLAGLGAVSGDAGAGADDKEKPDDSVAAGYSKKSRRRKRQRLKRDEFSKFTRVIETGVGGGKKKIYVEKNKTASQSSEDEGKKTKAAEETPDPDLPAEQRSYLRSLIARYKPDAIEATQGVREGWQGLKEEVGGVVREGWNRFDRLATNLVERSSELGKGLGNWSGEPWSEVKPKVENARVDEAGPVRIIEETTHPIGDIPAEPAPGTGIKWLDRFMARATKPSSAEPGTSFFEKSPLPPRKAKERRGDEGEEVQAALRDEVEDNAEAGAVEAPPGVTTTSEPVLEGEVIGEGRPDPRIAAMAERYGAPPSPERIAATKARLGERSHELGAEVEKYHSGMVDLFRKAGEKYGKLNWKTKVGVGLACGAGAAVSLGVALPLVALFATGLVGQRIAGFASTFNKLEKHFEKYGKAQTNEPRGFFGRRFEKMTAKDRAESAVLMAGVYSVFAGAAIGKGISFASNTFVGHAVHDWLNNHWPFNSGVKAGGGSAVSEKIPMTNDPNAPPSLGGRIQLTPEQLEAANKTMGRPLGSGYPLNDVAAESSVAPEAAAPATPSSSGKITFTPEQTSNLKEALAPVSIEMPSISVTAKPEFGYEYMAKRLWEQLQEKGLKFPPDSDAGKLLSAKNIDDAVHELAKQKNFFENGAKQFSKVVKLGAQMTVGADGKITML